MSLSGDIISNIDMDASIEAIGEIAGNIDLDGSGSTPTITASATVSPDPGIPACDVVKTGTDEYPNFAFNFSGLKGEPGEQGAPGQNGQNGADGSDGITPNLTATASVGASTGTPFVTVTRSGTDENPNFYFQFDNLKGEQGVQGEQGEPGSQGAPGSVPNVSASASVTNTSGTPAVTVTRTGSDANPNFDFAFENLKGEQGIQGIPGQNGQNGADGSDGVTPIVSATASADNSYGIPNVVVTRSGTDAAPSFDFAFHNIKGEPGTSGVPAGGATGQVLTKESNDDWDCDWQTLVIPSTAAEISFDNTGTGMTATDVQDAVTELKSNLTELKDITQWNHESVSVAPSALDSWAETTVSGLSGAKRCVVTLYESNASNASKVGAYEFINVIGYGLISLPFNYNTTASQNAYKSETHIAVDFENNKVKIRMTVKGSSATYRCIKDVYWI